MASKPESTSADEVVGGWNDSMYKSYPMKWGSKEEYDIVKKVLSRFQLEMAYGRQTSCPFADPEGGSIGTDWTDWWDRCDKAARMYRERIVDSDGGTRSNLKSAMSFVTIEAFMSEFQEVNNTITMSATDEKESQQILLHSKMQQAWENKRNIDELKMESARSTATFGTSLPYVGYKIECKKVDYLLTGKETKKEVEKKLKEYKEAKDDAIMKTLREVKPFIESRDVYTYNDCVYIPTSIYEIYVDPLARCLEGPSYEAQDIAWVQFMTLEQFRTEFMNAQDSFIIRDNIKRVKGIASTMAYYRETIPFFFKVDRTTKLYQNKVRVIRYYDKYHDRHYIIANDILIRKGPSPYNHNGKKKLPFVRHRLFILPDQFYGVGFPGYLEHLQAEEETLRNGQIDITKLNIGRKMIYNDQYRDAIEETWEDNRTGQKIGVPGPVDPSSINWSPSIPYMPDFVQLQQTFEQEAQKISGVNTMLYALPMKGIPVRNNMMANESSIKNIKKLIKNWNTGYKHAVWMNIMNRIQFFPVYYNSLYGADPIALKDITLKEYVDPESKKKQYEIEDKAGEVTYMNEFTEEMLQIRDIDVQLDTDALAPQSQGLKIQNAREALTLFSQIPPQLLENPLIVKAIREVITASGFSQDYLNALQQDSTDEDIKLAYEQQKEMDKGEDVPGIPGESFVHKYCHSMKMLELLSEKEQMGPINPMVTTLAQNSKVQEIDKILAIYGKHLGADSMPKDQASMIVPKIAQASAQPALPQMGMGQPMAPQQQGELPMGMMGPGQMQGMQAPQGAPTSLPMGGNF